MAKTTAPSAKAKTPARPRELTGRERRTLRALGHALSPVVQIGKAGFTKGVSQEMQGALEAHELIKVQLLGECPLERTEAAERISKGTGASVVQMLGRTLLLYKRNAEKPKLSLARPTPGLEPPDENARQRKPGAPARTPAPSANRPRTRARPATPGRRTRSP